MLFNIYYDLLFLTGKNILQEDGYYMGRQFYGVIDSEIFLPDTKRK